MRNEDKKRIELLTDDLYHHVFNVVDNEIELTGNDAGEIAQMVSQAFRIKMKLMLDIKE